MRKFEKSPWKTTALREPHYVADKVRRLKVSCEYYEGEAIFERCEGIWTLVWSDNCLQWMHLIPFEEIKNSLLLRECRWGWMQEGVVESRNLAWSELESRKLSMKELEGREQSV